MLRVSFTQLGISTPEAAMTTVAHRPPRGYRTLRLPLAEADYEQFISNSEFAKGHLDQLSGLHPELFPEAWGQG